MKKKKIISIIFGILVVFFVLNSLVALVSYNEVCNKKKPTINFGISKNSQEITYKELLYNVRVKQEDMTRTVSLKLFFLK